MNQATHIEHIICGSVLNNPAYLREAAQIDAEAIESPVTRRLFTMLPSLCQSARERQTTPLEVLFADCNDMELRKAAIVMATLDDFEALKGRYNMDERTKMIMGREGRITNVSFADYVNKLIQLHYGRNTITA